MGSGADITRKVILVAGASGGTNWHCLVEGVTCLMSLEVQGCNLDHNHMAQEDAPRPSTQPDGEWKKASPSQSVTRQTTGATQRLSRQARGIEEGDMANHVAPPAKGLVGC